MSGPPLSEILTQSAQHLDEAQHQLPRAAEAQRALQEVAQEEPHRRAHSLVMARFEKHTA